MEIATVERVFVDGAGPGTTVEGAVISFVGEGYAWHKVNADWLARFPVVPGGYHVVLGFSLSKYMSAADFKAQFIADPVRAEEASKFRPWSNPGGR